MNRFEDQANYYKNYHLRYRNTIAVIHVEDEDDKKFWLIELKKIKNGEYHFITQSKNSAGTLSKGCEQCLRFRPYLNRNFFICIDSDLRLLRGEKGLTAENHIAQTYAYSWENHSCEAEFLELRFREKINDSNFSFLIFLKEFSKIVYRPLLFLIFHSTPELNGRWNVSKFNRCIPTQLKRAELQNNCQAYLSKVQLLFENSLAGLNLPEDFSVEGLTPDNAYLHIQGHQLFNLVMNIGTLLCKGKRIAFRSEILEAAFPTFGYPEIDHVQSDLKNILRKN